ncbi:hypothetical protein GGR56DRAFT_498579 [Xylariaceae sp. FL0804]|nr:hypothetical protein GGR56DRAFT_498579 [Xylariaceae sp. FL0804]
MSRESHIMFSGQLTSSYQTEAREREAPAAVRQSPGWRGSDRSREPWVCLFLPTSAGVGKTWKHAALACTALGAVGGPPAALVATGVYSSSNTGLHCRMADYPPIGPFALLCRGDDRGHTGPRPLRTGRESRATLFIRIPLSGPFSRSTGCLSPAVTVVVYILQGIGLDVRVLVAGRIIRKSKGVKSSSKGFM